ncbi:MAG: MFS transporter, partial [Acidobacteria bacterium]|nr:MFS transporter [Acidobacteriota bacterium]
NVIQSAVGPEDRGEAGGLQYTAQQLGSAVGTALIGAVVISSLAGVFVDNIESDPRVDEELTTAVGVELNEGATFATADAVEQGLNDAGVDPQTISAAIENYEDAQLSSLKAGLLIAAMIALCALWFTSGLPRTRIDTKRVEVP